MFAASRSCLNYYGKISSFPHNEFDKMFYKLDSNENPFSLGKIPTLSLTKEIFKFLVSCVLRGVRFSSEKIFKYYNNTKNCRNAFKAVKAEP